MFISHPGYFTFLRNGVGFLDHQTKILKIATWTPTTFLAINQ